MLPKETRKVSKELESAAKAITFLLKKAQIPLTGGVGFSRDRKGQEGLTISVQIGYALEANKAVEAFLEMGTPIKIREQGTIKTQRTAMHGPGL